MSSSPVVLYARLMASARLRQLQLLVSVADHGTVKRAAAQLGMSQPAATQAIAELERLLEVRLFDRQVRGMRLSAAGQVVMPVARDALRALELSLEALCAVRAGASGLLRIGVVPAAALGVLEPCVAALGDRHPGLDVLVFEGMPEPLLKEFSSGGFHVLLMRRPAEMGDRFCFEPVCADELLVVAAPGHPLVTRDRVSISDLLACKWMRPPPGDRSRELFDEFFAGAGVSPVLHPVSTASPAVILSLLADNLTVALGPASAINWYVNRGLAVRLAVDFALPALDSLGVVYPREARTEPGVAAVLSALGVDGP